MASHIKQRVVGICVLVFLALILLPWLFGTNQPITFSANTPSTALKAPSKPIPDKIPEVVPVVVNEHVQNQELAETKPMINSEKLTKIQNNIVHAQSDTLLLKEEKMAAIEPLPKLEETKISKQKVAKPLPKIKLAAPDIKKIRSKIADKSWAIQLGTFSNKENAQKLLKQLKAKGYSAYTKIGQNAEGESITRVFVGPEAERHHAQCIMTKIEKSFKVHGVIVKSNL